MGIGTNPRFITVEEYIDGERRSEARHEYIGGEVYAMVGASDRHDLIVLNLAGIGAKGVRNDSFAKAA